MKTDTAIRKAILGKIKSAEALKSDKITVEVNRGVVTLGGCVRDTLEKRLAERLVKHVKEVRAVALDLQVMCPIGDSDTQIAVEIVDIFTRDPRLSDENIIATVDNAWVTLEGEVSEYCKKVLAFNVVDDIPGVRGITNRITVSM